MDNKRVDGTKKPRSLKRWAAAIGLFAILSLAGGWLFGPTSHAQDNKDANAPTTGTTGTVTYPFPSAPIVPSPKKDVQKKAPMANSGNGKVGYVTVDPYEISPTPPTGTAKKAKETAGVPLKVPMPPLQKLEAHSPPQIIVAQVPPAGGIAPPSLPAPTKTVAQAPVIVPQAETPIVVPEFPKALPPLPKIDLESPKSLPLHPNFTVESSNPLPVKPMRVVENPKKLPVLENGVNPSQLPNLTKDKFDQPAILVPDPAFQLATAQKDQPVPLPLPQVIPPPGGEKPGVLPQPRPLSLPPFGMDQVRTPLLGDAEATPLGATPHPTAQELAEQAKYVDRLIDPANTLDLIQGRARLMMMKATPKRIQVSDETIVGYTVIDNKEITILGKTPGTTVFNMWFVDKDDKTKEKVLSYLIRVFPDPEQKNRLERVFRALEIEINKHFRIAWCV
jgi:hypothetical protein